MGGIECTDILDKEGKGTFSFVESSIEGACMFINGVFLEDLFVWDMGDTLAIRPFLS
jgi:hypothetical protein